MSNIATTSGLSDAFVHLSGFLFVLLVLTMLWFLVESIGYFFRHQDKKKKAAATQELKSSGAVSSASSGADNQPEDAEEELLAVIASAVTLMLGTRQHRIVSIQRSGVSWSREGRRQHVQSHTYR